MPLLAAAVQDGYGGVLAAEEQGADPVRAADLVAGDGHRGEAGGREVDGDLADGLDGVGVQGDAELGGGVGESADRHDRADLVVRPHDGGEGDGTGVAGDGLTEGLGVDAAVAVDGEVLDVGALVRGEPVDGVEHGVVLDRTGEDAGAAGVGVAAGPVEALHGEVVGLGAAGGEDDLAGPRAERGGEHLAPFLDGPPGASAGGVQGGGVARDGEVGGHRLDRLGQHGRGRGVVEVSHGGSILRVDRGGPGAWPVYAPVQAGGRGLPPSDPA
ncbi:hypothetical protein BLIC30S_01843 [Bacillus licheniformis]